jgi:hypothetical protein
MQGMQEGRSLAEIQETLRIQVIPYHPLPFASPTALPSELAIMVYYAWFHS